MTKYILYSLCFLAFTVGCNSTNKTESHEGHDHEPNEEHSAKNDNTESSHADEIIFTSEQAKLAQVEVISIAPNQFHQVIKTSGQILSASGDEVTVSATSNGIVSYTKMAVSEGLAVSRGESLLNISSENIVDGDPIAKARIAYTIAEREYQRAESLIKDKLISEKEYNEIKLGYENAKIIYRGFAQDKAGKGAGISAPIGGFIKSKFVTEGQYVEVGQPLFTITQNRKLQLRCDVSERYYKDLKSISSANFATPYDETVHQLTKMNGRLISYGKATSNDAYYIPIIFEFDNIGDVVSGSYVEVFLLGQSRSNVLTVPVSSLVEEQGQYFVYTQLDAEGYKKQAVKLGASDGTNTEIISGLTTGDKVVSKGAYNIKLASASASIPDGHQH